MRIENVGQQTIHSVKSLFQKVKCCVVVFCDNGDRFVARAMAGDHDLSEDTRPVSDVSGLHINVGPGLNSKTMVQCHCQKTEVQK